MTNAKTALSHFIWFLPDGTRFSIDTFSSNVVQLQQPVNLNVTTKNAILNNVITGLKPESSNSVQGLTPALDRALQMFRSGMEIIIITSASESPTGFALKVSDFKSNLIGPYVISLTAKTLNLMADLAQLGMNYFVPPNSASQTWIVDTLQAVYSQTASYHRTKVKFRLIKIII